ncbi:MAG: helix-turn-helix domain-containing protein [Candidatus Omnitrophica bacterium]|nr:helix-turn-helix domain-containing protein [Candidatus Omnitrophota bacterium]
MPITDNNNDKSSILKSTRETRGLTLEFVHEATKIPMDVLKAIEEGYSVRILSPFYYRGFIKIYAEFLGLDVSETFKKYGLEPATKSPGVVTLSTNANRRSALPQLSLGQAQARVSDIFSSKNIKKMAQVIGLLVGLFLLFKVGGCIASHIHKKTLMPSRGTSTYLPLKEKKVKVHKYVEEQNSVPAVVIPEVKHESLKAQSENHKVEVAVRAVRDTWIQVKTDDKMVFEGAFKKGSVESWSADNHIELSGRNIDQLDMEINGKHIGSLGLSERRIKKVLITKEGLTVKK